MSSWCESKGYRFSFFGFAGCLADGAAGGLGATTLGTVRLGGGRWGGCVIVAGGLAGGGGWWVLWLRRRGRRGGGYWEKAQVVETSMRKLSVTARSRYMSVQGLRLLLFLHYIFASQGDYTTTVSTQALIRLIVRVYSKYKRYLVIVTVLVVEASFTWLGKFRDSRGGACSGEI